MVIEKTLALTGDATNYLNTIGSKEAFVGVSLVLIAAGIVYSIFYAYYRFVVPIFKKGDVDLFVEEHYAAYELSLLSKAAISNGIDLPVAVQHLRDSVYGRDKRKEVRDKLYEQMLRAENKK